MSSGGTVGAGLAVSLGVGLVCGLLNGTMVVGLPVHPFVITLGTMWMLRGIAFVTTKAVSILVPFQLTSLTKASLGLRGGLYPVPMLVMIAVTIVGWLYLTRTVIGRPTPSVTVKFGAAALTNRASTETLVPAAPVPVTRVLPVSVAPFCGPVMASTPPAGVEAGPASTTIVRVTLAESRCVSGSLATSVMTFEPGTSFTTTEKWPCASAVMTGFSRSPSTVTREFGSVTPVMVYSLFR